MEALAFYNDYLLQNQVADDISDVLGHSGSQTFSDKSKIVVGPSDQGPRIHVSSATGDYDFHVFPRLDGKTVDNTTGDVVHNFYGRLPTPTTSRVAEVTENTGHNIATAPHPVGQLYGPQEFYQPPVDARGVPQETDLRGTAYTPGLAPQPRSAPKLDAEGRAKSLVSSLAFNDMVRGRLASEHMWLPSDKNLEISGNSATRHYDDNSSATYYFETASKGDTVAHRVLAWTVKTPHIQGPGEENSFTREHHLTGKDSGNPRLAAVTHTIGARNARGEQVEHTARHEIGAEGSFAAAETDDEANRRSVAMSYVPGGVNEDAVIGDLARQRQQATGERRAQVLYGADRSPLVSNAAVQSLVQHITPEEINRTPVDRAAELLGQVPQGKVVSSGEALADQVVKYERFHPDPGFSAIDNPLMSTPQYAKHHWDRIQQNMAGAARKAAEGESLSSDELAMVGALAQIKAENPLGGPRPQGKNWLGALRAGLKRKLKEPAETAGSGRQGRPKAETFGSDTPITVVGGSVIARHASQSSGKRVTTQTTEPLDPEHPTAAEHHKAMLGATSLSQLDELARQYKMVNPDTGKGGATPHQLELTVRTANGTEHQITGYRGTRAGEPFTFRKSQENKKGILDADTGRIHFMVYHPASDKWQGVKRKNRMPTEENPDIAFESGIVHGPDKKPLVFKTRAGAENHIRGRQQTRGLSGGAAAHILLPIHGDGPNEGLPLEDPASAATSRSDRRRGAVSAVTEHSSQDLQWNGLAHKQAVEALNRHEDARDEHEALHRSGALGAQFPKKLKRSGQGPTPVTNAGVIQAGVRAFHPVSAPSERPVP